MALSMDEQRALAEIERRLATDDPGLATCMTAFRRPGPGRVLRSPRARIIGSLFTVLLVAMVSLMVYAMIPFRTQRAHARQPSAGTSSNCDHGHRERRVPAKPPARVAPAGPAASTAPASASAPAKASQAEGQAAGQAASPAAGP